MKQLNEKELTKLGSLFRFILPKQVDIWYEKDLYRNGYLFIFRELRNGCINTTGFYCFDKNKAQKNIWYTMQDIYKFFNQKQEDCRKVAVK